ncbi:MAG: sigma-70 family RNA polymerase sigma factor [Planctomycetes bacterium]|nr:sigma-70 family RNA polymerase sigma factor [Planctomycetota bacterium]
MDARNSSGDAGSDPSLGDSLLHTDATRWEALIQSINPAAMHVVIASAMSKALREHCSAEDLWQETLAHAWRDREQHRWTGPAAFRAWLFEIARNRIRETARHVAALKRGGTQRTSRFSELRAAGAPADGGSVSISASLPLDSQTPSRIVSREEKVAVTREALAELPPELREIVRLHVIEELTMEAIAERLGIGLSAAWHRHRKAMELLSKRLRSGAGDASLGAG